MRIAILEDDPDQLALLQRMLADDGHDLHGFTSGREATKTACPTPGRAEWEATARGARPGSS
mgnify:CR=1 FL=1